ncbi:MULTISPECIES: hypothetical protein [Pseudomonas]|uniref:Uncharacterized protein n=1 Tax=Pseudomonas phytophila TaxID=2867264 RepID=A0ABY6FGQ9_9PSED|nr:MULTISPECIES: hypothetical protein [Pseudomonas]MDU8358286.1 hypothetical protein [Pseudomonas syringae group sp. J309-1]UXZ97034.1 hypothetical protein K3169_03750 [Pseudomonas phytophila]
MLIINNNSVRAQGFISTLDSRPSATANIVADEVTDQASTGSSVSVLARQISAAASRAQARDASLDPQALGQKASQLLDELLGGTHQVKQANTFANPFQGMPRDQLALIAYDEGGDFPFAERAAALQESSSLEQRWRQNATQHALLEYDTTGKMTGFFNEALSHFKSLAPIEQSQYPVGYAVDLQQKIELYSGSKMSLSVMDAANPLEVIQQSLPELAFTQALRLSEQPKVVPPSQVDVAATQANKVGRQLMVERLFGVREPAIADASKGLKFGDLARNECEYLTKEDRGLLSDIYAYAQGEDVDMEYVDGVARSLGHYRMYGHFKSDFNKCNYDLQGWKLTVAFPEEDAVVASRILNGAAINSTRLDPDFLRYALTPASGALVNLGYFEFMEHVVTKFSDESNTAAPVESTFSSYVPRSGEGYYVMTTSSTVRMANFVQYVVSEGGVLRLTEKGRALRGDSGEGDDKTVRPHLELVRTRAGLEILREWPGNDLHPREPGWLGSLWDRLGEM